MAQSIIQINLGNANAFFIQGKEGGVLVDTGNPDNEARILRQLAEHSIQPRDVSLILITHGHVDHFGSLAAVKEKTGAPVAVHGHDADAVREGIHQPDSLQPTGWFLAFLMRFRFLRRLFVAFEAQGVEPDVVFEGELDLATYGVAGRAIPTPGHTPGSVTVLLDSGEAIVGDMVMGKLLGLRPSPGPPIVAWDLAKNQESVRQLLSHSPARIYTGHGGPFTFAQVDQWMSTSK